MQPNRTSKVEAARVDVDEQMSKNSSAELIAWKRSVYVDLVEQMPALIAEWRELSSRLLSGAHVPMPTVFVTILECKCPRSDAIPIPPKIPVSVLHTFSRDARRQQCCR